MRQNLSLVTVSGFMTFLGFSGTSAITSYLKFFWPEATDGSAQLIFNLTAFVLFLLGILFLVFNFNGKHVEASRAVARLAAFGNEVEDRLCRQDVAAIETWELDAFRAKYTAIMESIPDNTDEEYLQAKADFVNKQHEKRKVGRDLSFAFVAEEQGLLVRQAVENSDSVMEILAVIRAAGPELFAGGGLIRNLIWDRLHNFKVETACDDVDVIYFDEAKASKEHDAALEDRLRAESANVLWSVKNQARMHKHNNEAAYGSLEEAISKWPETATAILCRLDAAGQLHFIAPYGFDDLVRLLVVPTPHFVRKESVIVRRIRSKGWTAHWPRLRLALSPEGMAQLTA